MSKNKKSDPKANIPKELDNQIQELINAKIHGIKSRDEFVRESIKEKLLDYQQATVIKENFEKITKKGD